MSGRVIHLDRFRQGKQSHFMRRNRSRLDTFIRNRIPSDAANYIVSMVEDVQRQVHSETDAVWDYVELRELMLNVVTEEIAKEIFTDLQQEFWFDARWISLDMVSERCLSFMIIGETTTAAKAR